MRALKITMPDRSPGWGVVQDDALHHAHVLPIGDTIEHEPLGNLCSCGPRVEDHECGGCGVEKVIFHHSLDGRENRPSVIIPLRNIAAGAVVLAVVAWKRFRKE